MDERFLSRCSDVQHVFTESNTQVNELSSLNLLHTNIASKTEFHPHVIFSHCVTTLSLCELNIQHVLECKNKT